MRDNSSLDDAISLLCIVTSNQFAVNCQFEIKIWLTKIAKSLYTDLCFEMNLKVQFLSELFK